ncbi:MAG: TIM44-related membrane protein TimA [Alphaproteobacteria bacterium]
MDSGQVSQLITMIIFAGAAIVVLYQLYAVLGRRVGRQPEDLPRPSLAPSAPDEVLTENEPVRLTGLAALRARDPGFDVGKFLTGARAAYEMIVKDFAEGDRDSLKTLLAPNVLAAFEKVIEARETAGETQSVEFIQAPRGDLENIKVDGDQVQIKVRFLAEQRLRTRTAAGEAVDDRRTAEVWTFERNLKSRDPNWLLVRVDAAEA